MKNFEVWAHIQQQQMKFFYSLTALSFAILGLSIQFSPGYGKSWPLVLILSWSILLVSAIIGGWRLIMIPNLHRIDFETQDIKKFISDIQKAESWPGPVIGDIPSPDTKQKAKDNISKAESYKLKQQSRIEWTYYVQIYGFILGVILNLIFISINYLEVKSIL